MTAPQVYAAALAALPGLTTRRLRELIAGASDPSLRAAWERAIAERKPRPAVDLDAVEARLTTASTTVTWFGAPDYPERLLDDPEPPAVLFVHATRGVATLEALRRPTVAVVGTRRCTRYGAEVAGEIGRALTSAGVCVVSGLALGIDGAAHEGALAAPVAAAPPVAIVGSGVDVVYPRRHRRLWSRVAEAGAVVSEAPLGAEPEPWRFPSRNRIIAGLADVVVVVESHAAGGSMHTVQSAIDRGVPVMAVPGSVRSPSSAGTNRLLAEGVAPVLDVDDVLMALSLETGVHLAGAAGPDTNPRPELQPSEQSLLDAVDFAPTATEAILRRTGLALGSAAAGLARLEMAGMVRSDGGWWERVR
jgi:DNA processing protein